MRLRLVKEEVLRNPKCAVCTDDRNADHEGGDENGADAGEEDDDDCGDEEDEEHLPIGELATEEGDRWIGRLAEEVEEQPGGEERGQEEKGERVGEEGDGDDGGDDDEVINAVIVVILPDALRGVGDRVRLAEARAVEEIRPGAVVGEASADGVGDASEEGAEGGGWIGGFRDVGLGGGGGEHGGARGIRCHCGGGRGCQFFWFSFEMF